jgi:hypothetical protein
MATDKELAVSSPVWYFPLQPKLAPVFSTRLVMKRMFPCISVFGENPFQQQVLLAAFKHSIKATTLVS